MGLAATQVNVFVNTVLATGEGTGAISWLNYAFRLMYLPIGLFGVHALLELHFGIAGGQRVAGLIDDSVADLFDMKGGNIVGARRQCHQGERED